MTITDAHIHLLPGRLAQRVAAHLPGPPVYPLEHDAVLAQLHAEGVDTFGLRGLKLAISERSPRSCSSAVTLPTRR